MASIFSGRNGRLAAIWAAEQLEKGKSLSLAELDRGFDFAREQEDKAQAVYGPHAARYGRAAQMYSRALGLEGRQGAAAAAAAFRAGPGHAFAMDQGLQALARQRASQGMLASGNTDADTLAFATGLADRSYGDWLGRLSDLDARGLQAAGAQAGTAMDLGRIGQRHFADRADVIRGTADGVAQAGRTGFEAGDRAAANRFGAIMSGIDMAGQAIGSLLRLGMPGGGTVGGRLVSRLFG